MPKYNPKKHGIVINADDFGYNPAINQAVTESFSNGWISSATVMATGSAFGEACAAARDRNFAHRIGLHLDLKNASLTDDIKKCERIYNDGAIRLSPKRGIYLSSDEQRALAREVEAQWQACHDNGIEPSHLDSHTNTHHGWSILSVILRLAPALGIPAIRLCWNVVPHRNLLNRTYYAAINARIRGAGLARTRYTAHGHQGRAAVERGLTPLEIVSHPQLNDDGTFTDGSSGLLLSERLAGFGIDGELCGYRDLS